MTNDERYRDFLDNAPKYVVDGVVLVNTVDVFGGEESTYVPLDELVGGPEKKSPRGSGGQRTDKPVVEETSNA